MKKGSFKGLVFREFYIARKNYAINLLGYLSFAIIALLALLSLKCGNLHRYSHLIGANALKSIESWTKLVPAIMACCFFGAISDAIPKDEKTPWRRFRIACPVTPFRQALAKYACQLLAFICSFGLSFGWFGLHSLITGSALTQGDITTILSAYAVIVVLMVYMQIVAILARTLEKTMLIVMATVYGIVIFVFIKYPQVIDMMDTSNPAGMNKLKEIGTKFLPFTPVIIIGAFLVGLLCTTMLYKRREK